MFVRSDGVIAGSTLRGAIDVAPRLALHRTFVHHRTVTKLLRLPDRGRLLVCTDLQGHLGDFEAMAAHFERARVVEPDTHLVIAGDFVHGPDLAPDAWEPWLGEYYVDDSIGVFEGIVALRRAHPGRVHVLLGNHEHGHVGGVRTAKFFPDEVDALERRMSRSVLARFREFCASLPLVACSAAGVVITHAAPAARISGPEAIERVRYQLDALPRTLEEVFRIPILGPLLWARASPADVARRFIQMLLGRSDGIAVYGHDVVAEGYEVGGDGEQLCLSTSFGLFDVHKRYLDLDLSRRWTSALELREGVELLPLHPLAPPRPVWDAHAAWR